MVISEDVSVQVVLRKNMGLTKPLITYIFTIIIIIIIDITFTPRWLSSDAEDHDENWRPAPDLGKAVGERADRPAEAADGCSGCDDDDDNDDNNDGDYNDNDDNNGDDIDGDGDDYDDYDGYDDSSGGGGGVQQTSVPSRSQQSSSTQQQVVTVKYHYSIQDRLPRVIIFAWGRFFFHYQTSSHK